MSQPARTSRPFSIKEQGNQLGRSLALMALYIVILGLCRYLAYELRFDFVVPHEFQQERLVSITFSLPVELAFLLVFRQFGSLLTYFSVPDLLRIAAAMASANLATYLLRLGLTPGLTSPRGVILADFVFSVGALSLMRLGFRIYRERYLGDRNGNPKGKAVRRIAILGAGDAGAEFVREVQAKPSLGLKPIFFLDDDWKKHGKDIHGISVLGTPEDIPRLRKENAIDACILAMPSASGRRLQEIYKLLLSEGLKVEIVPSIAELATGRVQVTKIRPVQVDDLLGRDAVDLRDEKVSGLVQDKIVLVTGAGGSIGSELCRQLAGYNPQRLLMVDQTELGLFQIEAELNERGFQNVAVPLVADILDLPRMRTILERHRPEIVFHAAAHKHVYMMERQPGEAVKNNTTGTRQLAALAGELGVKTFVMISTDKAINPTSAMGASKRLAEMHLQALQQRLLGGQSALRAKGEEPEAAREGQRAKSEERSAKGQEQSAKGQEPGAALTSLPLPLGASACGTRYIAVRFGNVLGSSGSVIPIFKKQIADGGPVTVTHPDVTRYFMTIPEAVGLVLQTAVMGKGGEIFVLDMGKPVKIVDLARQLIELSGLRPDEDIEIKFIGLRAGEKLFEELQHSSELLKPTTHERIQLLASNGAPEEEWVAACIREVEQQAGVLEPDQLKLTIKKLVPEYSPHLD